MASFGPDEILGTDAVDQVLLHVYYGTVLVQDQVIALIPGCSNIYRLVPPSGYPAAAWAFSTQDLFVKDNSDQSWLVNVFRLEPISGILTVLTPSPPAEIKVTYRYYLGFHSLKVKDLKKIDPAPQQDEVDMFGQGIYPLQNRFPQLVSWKFYGENVNLIKSFLRDSIRQNDFMMVVDDNICQNTWFANAGALLRPGWAAEGPVFCDDIDLVDRGAGGGSPTTLFKIQVHQYGDYWWHHPQILPDYDWWPDCYSGGGGGFGWHYWHKCPDFLPPAVESDTCTPSVPYGWPDTGDPSDWWIAPPAGVGPPSRLPILTMPPGGWIWWHSNIPPPS